jgi:hypothetical protein
MFPHLVQKPMLEYKRKKVRGKSKRRRRNEMKVERRFNFEHAHHVGARPIQSQNVTFLAIDPVMDDDPVVSVLPIHYSNALSPNLHIHQFPLLSRPLQTPPSAALSGKRIRARIKPNVRRLEVHVPADTRSGFWNVDKSKELGAARTDDDRDKNQEVGKGKQREGEEPRLGEVRMRSEQIPQKGAYMLGIVRGG